MNEAYVNVAINGQHLFATSWQSEHVARMTAQILKESLTARYTGLNPRTEVSVSLVIRSKSMQQEVV